MSEEAFFDRHGGNVYQAVRQTGNDFADFLDFSANINPLGLSENVLKSLSDSLKYIIHYPDVEAYDLKKAVSDYYHVPLECITPGNGAVELMYILCYILRPKSVLVTAPAFSEYERAACASGSKVQRVYLKPEHDFALNVEEIVKTLADIDMVFIGNPNNPTGTLTTNHDLEYLLKSAGKYKVWVVIDEAFMDFLTDDSNYTCRIFLQRYPKLIITNSLTKFYAIPGLRLGFALTNPDLAQRLHAAKDQWNVNSLAQLAGVAALQDTAYQRKTRECVRIFQDILYNGLVSVQGLRPYRPVANYILVNISGTGMSSRQMEQELFNKNILIRDCGNYPGLSSEYIRVAVKLPEQNERLIETIKQIVGDK